MLPRKGMETPRARADTPHLQPCLWYYTSLQGDERKVSDIIEDSEMLITISFRGIKVR